MRNWECGMRKPEGQRIECGIGNVECGNQRDRELNAELGMRKSENKELRYMAKNNRKFTTE